MTQGYTEAIQSAFESALTAFGVANSIKVGLENISISTNTATPYLAGFMIPADIESADLYFTDRRSGIYQIDINYASTLGSAPINRMVDKLNAAFKPSTSLTRDPVCVEITKFSHERITAANGWATKPVTIEWVTHTERL
jgi:hypothetical protein